MFKSKTDERVTRSQATGIVSAFLRSTASQQLSEDVSHKLLIVRKFISRRRGDREKTEEGCFHSHLVECKFGLTAAELGDAETAITQKLSAYVLGAHVMEYMGVLLAFSKFEVPQFTPLKWDLPHIFVTVTVRMLVFDPAHSDLLCKWHFMMLVIFDAVAFSFTFFLPFLVVVLCFALFGGCAGGCEQMDKLARLQRTTCRCWCLGCSMPTCPRTRSRAN